MAVTIKDIARSTGLSLATVSKYLNGGNVETANRIAIERAIHETGYVPNHIARSLRTADTRTIGIVIPYLNSVFVSETIASLETELHRHNYNTILFDCRGDRNLELRKLDFLINNRVDGAALITTGLLSKDFRDLENCDIPVVLIDAPVPGYNTDMVLLDNAGATAKATHYLIENGHERTAIICAAKGVYTSDERLKGYLRAYKEKGLSPDPALICHGDYSMDSAYKIVMELMKSVCPPSAILMTNYDITVGAIMALNKLGADIPKDVSIIGFDNNHLSEIFRPPLTVISQPMQEIGKSAAELLLRRLRKDFSDHPQVLYLDAKFEINGTVSPKGGLT